MISVICAVRDRLPPLRVSLTSWLLVPSIREIVIVDWSSSKALATELAQLDGRVRIIRVDGEDSFHLAAAFNLAADCAQQPMLLKLDADYVINPYTGGDVSFCAIPPKHFVTGHFQHGGPFFSYLNGLVAVRREDWYAVNGYNENLVGYGWDDDDFYIRLQGAGLKRAILEPTNARVFHIPHDDNVRTNNYSEKDKSISYYYNRKTAGDKPYTARLFRWSIVQTGPQVFTALKQK